MNEQVEKAPTEKASWVETEAAKIVPPRAGGDNKLPETKAADPVEDADDEADDIDGGLEPKGKKGESVVNQKALHRERERRKKTEAELQRVRDESTRASERLSMIQQAWEAQQTQPAPAQTQVARPQAQDDPEPDKQTDVLAWIDWRDRQHARELDQIKQHIRQTEGLTQQQQMAQEITSSYAVAARQFSEKTPDFRDAYSFLWKELDQDLQDRGITDPAMRQRILLADEFSFAAEQRKLGRNPAEIVYGWAKRRGYKAAAQNDEAQTVDPAPALAEVAQQNRRNEAARSLSGAGGRAPSNVTLKDIAEMDPDDFKKAVSGKNWDKLLRQAAR